MKKLTIISFAILISFFACVEDFSTELPTVTTSPITELTAYQVVSGGNVTSNGDSPIIARGLHVTTDENITPTLIEDYGTWYTEDSIGIGNFESKAKLVWRGAAGTIRVDHYIRAYATNKGGTAFGEVIHVTPKDRPLVDNAIKIKDIITSSTSVTINYTFHYLIGYSVDEQGICYGTGSNASIDGDYIAISDPTEGDNVISIEGLTPNTKYFVRSYARNESGIHYSLENNFTTSSY